MSDSYLQIFAGFKCKKPIIIKNQRALTERLSLNFLFID